QASSASRRHSMLFSKGYVPSRPALGESKARSSLRAQCHVHGQGPAELFLEARDRTAGRIGQVVRRVSHCTQRDECPPPKKVRRPRCKVGFVRAGAGGMAAPMLSEQHKLGCGG